MEKALHMVELLHPREDDMALAFRRYVSSVCALLHLHIGWFDRSHRLVLLIKPDRRYSGQICIEQSWYITYKV